MQANLEEFEKAVYGRRRVDRVAENDKAVTALLQCLTALRDGSGFEGYLQLSQGLMTRMVSAVVSLFCDPHFKLTQAGFDAICSERAVLDTVFIGSAYQSADFVFSLIQPDEEGVTKYLTLFCINSKLALDWEQIFSREPQAMFPLWLSLISYGQTFTKEASELREKLMDLAPLFETVVIPSCMFNTLCGAYMHCSYAYHEGKHDVKRVFHKMMARMFNMPPVAAPVRKERPTIMVINEWWWSKHAMYRSYAKSIRQLRQHFRLVGACPGKNTDQEAKDVFDEWVQIDSDNMILNDLAERVRAVNPDIIYYPSIGMAIWSICLSSLRLAPIQVMTYGHPATSNSPVIDYGIIEGDCYVKECFSESIITLPPNVVRPTEFERCESKHKPRKTDTLKIGVAAMQVKLSWPFIQAMQDLERRSPKPVEFVFFGAATGIGLFSMASELGKLLKKVTVQEKQIYSHYLESVSECDLVLYSFPFGGANSMYDSLAVGVPMVSLEGLQPHSRSDASIIRRAGLPESLIAHTPEEYVDAIIRLTDDAERAHIAGLVQAVDLQQFYTPDESGAFLEAFKHIYEISTVEKAA